MEGIDFPSENLRNLNEGVAVLDVNFLVKEANDAMKTKCKAICSR